MKLSTIAAVASLLVTPVAMAQDGGGMQGGAGQTGPSTGQDMTAPGGSMKSGSMQGGSMKSGSMQGGGAMSGTSGARSAGSGSGGSMTTNGGGTRN